MNVHPTYMPPARGILSSSGKPTSTNSPKEALVQLAWIENAPLADQFVNLVKAGNLREFERFVKEFVDRPHQLAEVTNLAAKRINCPEVWIPHATVSFNGSEAGSRIRDMCVVSFRLERMKRILCLATDPSTSSLVAGPSRYIESDLPVKLAEDPILLFQQIGRLVSLPRVVGPPPLARI